MPSSRSIAIVILNWNGINLFDRFLPSVILHSGGANIRIIIADNGSTDGSAGFLTEHYAGVEILELKTNYGFATGYNRALESVKADYFVLLNTDIEVTPGWLEACINRLESDQQIAAVQPRIMSCTERDRFEYAGAAGGFIDRLCYPFCRGRILNVTEKDHGQYNTASPVFWTSGACMFIRSECFLENGGFDEDFWAHMEEIDLCWRLKNSGYSMYYESGSTVFHLGGGSLPYDNPIKVFLNFRNNLFMLIKNLPPGKLLPVMALRLALDWVAAARFLTELNLPAFLSVIRAHLSVCRNMNKFLRKRKSLSAGLARTRHKEIFPGSIIWNFFILNRRKFSDLDFKI